MRIFPPNGLPVKHKYHAPAGRCFSETDIEKVLEQQAEIIEKNHALWEFKPVQVAPNRFNFIYAGLREQSAA